jgi:hypothetical protein
MLRPVGSFTFSSLRSFIGYFLIIVRQSSVIIETEAAKGIAMTAMNWTLGMLNFE